MMENEIEKRKNFIAKIVEGFNEEILDKIIELEEKCFPQGWQFEDAKDYFSEALENKKNINVILQNSSNVVGYALFVPLGDVFEELSSADPEIENSSNTLYLETIEILPESRGSGGVEKMLEIAEEEAKKRGIEKISIHARKINNFNDKIKKIFGCKIISSRDIEKWKYGESEPYEYIDFKVD